MRTGEYSHQFGGLDSAKTAKLGDEVNFQPQVPTALKLTFGRSITTMPNQPGVLMITTPHTEAQ